MIYYRTTNSLESFHRIYNSKFYHTHPHYYYVIKVLLEFQSDTETKIRSITMYNDIKKLNAKQKERIEFTINDKYKSNRNNITFYIIS